MSTEIECEDLENVPLVRMEDVQPSRTCDINCESDSEDDFDEEILETCIVDDLKFEECVVNDDDSNIGSMVSIKSEEVVEYSEMIVPEVIDALYDVKGDKRIESKCKLTKDTEKSIPKPSDSWPTLEILPGGVINLTDKTNMTFKAELQVPDIGDKIYACAKCPMSFRHLYNLVKHVKWHEEEAKKNKLVVTSIQKKLADLKKRSHELDENFKKIKVSGTKMSSGKKNYIVIPTKRKTTSGKVPKKIIRIVIGKKVRNS